MFYARPIPQIIAISGGLIAWAAQFTIIYAITSVVCARSYADIAIFGLPLVRVAIVATTIAALAVTGLILVRAVARRRQRTEADDAERFMIVMTIWTAGLSLVVIFWHGLPALIVPVCS